MKKLIYMAVIALSFLSCENLYYIDTKDKNDMIVMNGILYADEEEHQLTLTKSTLYGLDNLDYAVVEVYVNGEKAAVADCEPDLYSLLCSFKANFSAGDKIKIIATSGDLSAEAEVVVPAEPLSIKTEAFVSDEDEYYYRKVKLKIDMKDDPDTENFYMLALKSKPTSRTTIYSLEGGEIMEVCDEESGESGWIEFDKGKDPILMDIYPLTSSSDDFFYDLIPSNVCNVFSDSRISASVATLTLTDISYERLFWWNFNVMYDPEVSRIEVLSFPALEVKLFSITKEAYRYFHSINSADVFGFYSNMITEPISFETNVRGGLGFVTVVSSKSETLSFEPEPMPQWYCY